MCGVLGIFSHKPVAQDIYDGLIHLQHRGQDAAGIITYNEKFHLKKDIGYVREVFNDTDMQRLLGNWGIGHTRYPTAGSKSAVEDAQPFMVNSPYGIAMAHNGDVTNYSELRKELAEVDKFQCNATCDVEVILNVFASKLLQSKEKDNFFENICEAVDSVFDRVKGAYSVVTIIAGKGMVAFRDPHGIRPFVCGTRTNEDGTNDFIFSSENTMFYPLNFKFQGNVQPGEVIYIDEQGQMWSKILRHEKLNPCVFEYVYLARPDSMINNVSVYRSRLRMGQNLANAWKNKYPDIMPDVVIPIPFSSNTAALAMAHELGVRYTEGLYKNPFVGRTFIMPGQAMRKKSVLQKLSPQEIEIRGKKVMLVDDSIVRGTTSKEVVKLVRNAGAKEVYFVSACPPVKFPCFYGVDMPTKGELIASSQNEEEIRKYIDTDILFYQTIDDLVEAVTRKGQHNISRLCMGCLDGCYVTQDISQEKIDQLGIEKGNKSC